MSTVYYTFNDCITGQPAVLDGYTYFEYIGSGIFNPTDLLGKTISSIQLNSPSENPPLFGCWTLTKFNGVPAGPVYGWDSIWGYTSSPSCEDCQYRVVGFVNPCVEASDGILFKVLESELSSYLVEDSFYIYNGPPVTSNSGGNMIPGYCYLFGINDISDPTTGLSVAPPASNFTLSNRDTCLDISCTNVLRDCCTDEILELNGKPLVLTGFPPDEYINKIITALYVEGSVEPEVTGCVKISLGIPYEVEDVIELGWNEVFADTVNTCQECQSCYYEIINCADEDEIYCTVTDLSEYANNDISSASQWPIINVVQFPEKCFYVQKVETCTAPINITVNPSIPITLGCRSCQEKSIVSYKLINCNNPDISIYTTSNLSEYAGDIITLNEYPEDCWFVEVLTTSIPNDIPVTFREKFPNCQTCVTPQYLLEDCNIDDPDPNIITNTDLSAYVGDIVRLLNCPDKCWLVSETDPIPTPQSVHVTDSFQDCEACAPEPPVPVPPVYKYKSITPGYDTPGCEPDKFERIVCNFSEAMYRQIMVDAYGITPCCGEDDIKYEIKYELIKLKAIQDPEYKCSLIHNCDCTTSTAGLSQPNCSNED